MKWIPRSYKKRQKRARETKWHRIYALVPRRIREARYDSVMVPEHCVWMEYVARRRIPFDDNCWEYRTYTDEPPIKDVAVQI